jgi:hypothetical protein
VRPWNRATLSWVLALAVVFLAWLVRIPLVQAREMLLPGDEVISGIMARDILKGHFPLYYYGQAYMGTLEAYVIAFFSLGMGMNGWTIQMGTFFFYALFLVTHFFLMMRLFGLAVSLLSSFFLVIAPVTFWELSLRALGGYSGTLFLGALSFLFWLRLFIDRKEHFAFPLGACLGIGLWLNPLFVVYLVPLIVMTLYREEGFQERARFLDPVRLMLVRDYPIPRAARVLFWAIHLGVAVFLLKQFVVFFTGGWEGRWLGFNFASPPFQWKGMKKILLLLGGEGVLWAFIMKGPRVGFAFFKRWFPVLFGLLLGYLPAIVYSLAGGEGHRVLHKSGMIGAGEVGGKARTLFGELLLQKLWGLQWDGGSSFLLDSMASVVLLIFFTGAFVFYFFRYRRGWASLAKLKTGLREEGFFFCLLPISILLITFASSLVADRYLAPLYWVTAVFAAVFLVRLSLVSRIIPLFVLFLFTGYCSLEAAEHLLNYSSQREIGSLIRVLEIGNLRGGVASYDNAYRLSFYSGGRTVFVPLEGVDRVPAYRERVEALEQKALLFDPAQEKLFFGSHPKFSPLDVIPFHDYKIYVAGKSFRLNR